MSLIKKIKSGNSEIEIYNSEISEEEQKNNLYNLYKTINNIADNQRANGKNVDDWFYSNSELQDMKKSGKYNFLQKGVIEMIKEVLEELPLKQTVIIAILFDIAIMILALITLQEEEMKNDKKKREPNNQVKVPFVKMTSLLYTKTFIFSRVVE